MSPWNFSMKSTQPGQQLVISGSTPLPSQQARFELGGLFDDGEIGAEVGVEDRLEAHAAKRRVDLAGEVGADREAEGLADGHAHRGRDLRHAVSIRVVQLLPHLHGFVVLDDGSGGAVRGALAATHAGRVGQGNVAGRGDARVEAAVQEAQRPDVLVLLADLDAAAAGDALARSRARCCASSRRWACSGTMLSSPVHVSPKSAARVCSSQFWLRRQVRHSLGCLREDQLQHRTPDLARSPASPSGCPSCLRRACNRRAASCRCS